MKLATNATLFAASLVAALLFAAPSASALPRFAARSGQTCVQCHVSPSGGGVRNHFGRNVFERNWLPLNLNHSPENWLMEEGPPDPAEGEEGEDGDDEPDDGGLFAFSADLVDGLALGADFRLAYIWIRPDRGLTPGSDPTITSSFFLMQADLYVHAQLHENVAFVLDMGVYSGFEAWALIRAEAEPEDFDLMVRAGRFLPAFGIREVEHQLFTREGVGFGTTDLETGVEVSAYLGPVTWQVALVNGSLGGPPFDAPGSDRRDFEMAIVSRAAVRAELGWARFQLGGSFYFGENGNQANPLLSRGIPSTLSGEIGVGVREYRVGAFATANIGRFTYLGDLVFVRNNFASDMLFTLEGYASYQELSVAIIQGLDAIVTFEFADPDIQLLDNTRWRLGGVIELFPLEYTELRLMVRRTSNESALTGGGWDVVAFLHLFM